MNFDTLNELVSMPKKSEASKAKKKLYIDQMVTLLSEEGVSQDAVKYLKGGFTFAGAKPVAIYLQRLPEEKRHEEISKLLSTELFRGSDKLISFRFGISLSAYSIELFGTDQRLLIEMIKVLPSVSKNKEKQLLKDAPKIFEKYFLEIVSDSTALPGIDVTMLKEFQIREYRNMMSEILKLLSDEYKMRTARIAEWIGIQNVIKTSTKSTQSSESSSQLGDANAAETSFSEKSSSLEAEHTNPSNNPQAPLESVADTSTSAETSVKQSVPLNKKDLTSGMASFAEYWARIEATIDAMIRLQKELDLAKNKMDDLQKKIHQTEASLSNEQTRNEQMTSELSERSKIIGDLRGQLVEAKKEITLLEEKNKEATTENARLNSIISVYSSDKQNSQSEQLNAIASKLKSEYRDFKDAENEEMTIDLGENFRFQIQSIFRILAKVGIDVERR